MSTTPLFESIALIGAGRLGQTLALALAAQGLKVGVVASRTAASAHALAARIAGCRALAGPAGLAEAAASAELVLLTVPDDAIAPLAAQLRWRPGQTVLHCSGATEIAVLEPARRAGAAIGGFHPLQIFSDPASALQRLPGSAVALEAGDAALEPRLHALAELLGLRPFTLPPGSRAAYHAAAGYAASFLLSLLDEARQLWAATGLPQELALQALLPLAEGTLAAARARGLPGALSGPISRGDLGVLRRHLAALDGLGGEHGRFYRELAGRQLALAQAAGRLTPAALDELRAALAGPPS